MKVYLLKDTDPAAGFFDVLVSQPDPRIERKTLTEIRVGEIPDDEWNKYMEGVIAIDPVNFYDDFYEPYFNEATVLWTRKGGYVNGTV